MSDYKTFCIIKSSIVEKEKILLGFVSILMMWLEIRKVRYSYERRELIGKKRKSS